MTSVGDRPRLWFIYPLYESFVPNLFAIMPVVKRLLVDVSSSQFATKLQRLAYAFVFLHYRRPPEWVARQVWRFEIWIIRQLMEDLFIVGVVNHYDRKTELYVAFQQYVRQQWPDYELAFSECFHHLGIGSHHLPEQCAVEYNRLDVFIIRPD